MDRRKLESFLPSKRVLIFAGILGLVGVVYLFTSTGFLQTINVFSGGSDQIIQNSGGDNESSFLANQNPPESGSIAEGDVATVTEQNNITERTANSVAPRALALAAAQENGENISQKDIARVASSMSANIEVSKPETFQQNDFSQYSQNTQANVKSYAKEITEIIYNQASQGPKTPPPKIIADYLQNKSDNLSAIDRHINLNKTLVQKLENTKVPPQYISLHIKLTEGFSLAVSGLQKIKQVDDDPTVTIMGIRQYRQATDNVVTASDQLAKQLDNDINDS